MPDMLSFAVAQSYDIEPRVITSLLLAGVIQCGALPKSSLDFETTPKLNSCLAKIGRSFYFGDT